MIAPMESLGTGRHELYVGATLVLLSRDMYLTANQELKEGGWEDVAPTRCW